MLNGLFSGKPECFTIKSPYLFQRLAEYNFPTENGDVTYIQLKDMLIKIFIHETHSFKLNLSFGLILQNVQDLSYRYYYPLQQDPMLDSPVLISTIQDTESLMDRLVQMDLLDSILKGRRPDTKSKLRQIASVVFYVYRTNYVLGQGHDLPAFITNSKSIIALVKNRHTGRNYDDEKCFFRALAISKGYNIDALERPTNQLVYQWMQYKNHTHFTAVSLKDIAELEECFKTDINIYELLSPEVAKTVYVSISKYPASLFLNLYKNHLSYIKTFSTYANKYKCRLCEKIFSRIHSKGMNHLNAQSPVVKFSKVAFINHLNLFLKNWKNMASQSLKHRNISHFLCFSSLKVCLIPVELQNKVKTLKLFRITLLYHSLCLLTCAV